MSSKKIRYPAPKLNRFQFREKRGYTFNMGGVYPILCEYMMPNSRWKFKPTHRIKALALTAPIMDTVKCISYYFKVPLRLLCKDEVTFTNYYTGGKNDDDATPTPVVNSGVDGYEIGSLMDYLGYTTNYYQDNGDGTTSLHKVANFTQNAWALRAYNLIINECFINTNITNPRVLSLEPGLDDTTDRSLFYHSWPHDRFVNAMPSLNRGDPTYLPLGNEAAVLGNGMSLGITNGTSEIVLSNTTNYGLMPSAATQGSSVGSPAGSGVRDALNWGVTTDGSKSGLVADLSSASAIDVNELRNTIALGFAKNLSMYIGTHLSDYIYGVFGCRPADSRLQRPEFLGKHISALYVDEVEQTSATNDISAQGNLAGKAMTINGDNYITAYADEPCILMGLMVMLPETLYFQGSRRWMNYMSRYDFPNPLYAKISDQAIFQKEICAMGDSESVDVTYTNEEGDTVTTTVTNDSIYGFEPRFNEAYTFPNTIHGDLKGSLKYWTLAREFDVNNPPMLNDSFIYADNVSTRVFPLINQSVNKFIAKSYYEGSIVQPLPVDQLPSSMGLFGGW